MAAAPWILELRERSYLFIDGAYFRKCRDQVMTAMFGEGADTDYGKMASDLGCKKGFYYDCADEKRKTEDETTFKARLETQKAEFNVIRSYPGFHVFEGTLSGNDARRKLTLRSPLIC